MFDYNPWWLKEKHFIYEEWAKSDLKWVPPIINKLDVKPFSLNFIIGPRQVGKTTLVMIYIHEILLKRFDPKAIFYLPCDEISDYVELGEVLDDYLSYRESAGVKSSIIFLDEITFVEEWWRAIKSRIDSGRFYRDVIYVLGSASVDLIAGKERFPGRRGFGRDIYVLPLTFNEFEKLIVKRPINEMGFDPKKIDDAISSNMLVEKNIFDDFMTYLETGGFPLAIKEYFLEGGTSRAERSYLDWLRVDIVKSNKSEKVVKEILATIIRARLSPLSWLEIARETSVSSPNTVRSYIEMLEHLFVVKVADYIDPSGRIIRRKNRKIHISDPFLYKVFSRWVKEKVYEEQIVESVVAMHLNRVGNVYYWRNSSEIDVVLEHGEKLYGFEVKWGVRARAKKRPIKTRIITRKEIPLLLAGFNWI